MAAKGQGRRVDPPQASGDVVNVCVCAGEVIQK